MSTAMSSLFFTLAVLVALVYAYAFPAAQGFTLTMKHSVLSAPNLTHIQKHLLLLHASKSRSHSAAHHHPIRAPLSRALRSPFFYVEVGIGSPPVYVKLVFDTGSTMTWTQCAACKTCFPVAIPSYDPSFSSTYRQLPENHPVCRGSYGTEPSGKFCNFTIEYIDDELIRGQLSLETFVFGNSKHTVPEFVFGCGIDDENVFDFLNDTHNPISGVFGIGMKDPISILYQLRSLTELKFSYCLPLRVYDEDNKHRHHHHTLVHFGKKALIKNRDGVVVQTTPLLAGFGQDSTYYAKLNAISVHGIFLPIDPKVFTRDNGVGVVVDSGSPYTVFVEEAYKQIREAVVKYFLEKYGWEALKTGGFGFDLCYSMAHQEAIADIEFPKFEFHFEGGAVMKLIRDSVFQAFGHPVHELCLMIQPTPSDNMLGAFQMVNQRMLFDVGASKLSFVPESC